MAFRDNGDGTVTDDSTGLMWEKKAPVGAGGDNVHNLTFGYSWSRPGVTGDEPDITGTEPDGTAFTLFLRNLNEHAFAGHSDWRLPTRQELLSIVDRSFILPGTQRPAIDPIFGPTQPFFHWSADTSENPHYAWMVNFGRVDPNRNLPEAGPSSKVNEGWVRAVRTA